MKLQRAYIDTSVIGGCFDEEFSSSSNRLMRDFEAGRFKAVVSDIVEIEINKGHAQIQDQFRQLMQWLYGKKVSNPPSIQLAANTFPKSPRLLRLLCACAVNVFISHWAQV